MIVAVPKETTPGERRVALVPDAKTPTSRSHQETPTPHAVPDWLLQAAWIAPAVCVAASTVRAMLFEPEGTAPGVALSAIVSGLWIGASFVPYWRGTLLEIGRGRRSPEEIPRILAACDRSQAGRTAPAAGLTLVRVHYDAQTHPEGPPTAT